MSHTEFIENYLDLDIPVIVTDAMEDWLANDLFTLKFLYEVNVIKPLMGQVRSTQVLTLTLPGPSAGVSGSLDSYCSLKPLCSGMGEVVPARTSPTLLPPSPRTVLSLSCIKVSQCINCRDWHIKS